MHNIVITPFNNQPADRIFDLLLPIQRDEFGFQVTRQDQKDLEEIPVYYQNGNGNFWLALHGDALVGTIALKDIGDNQVALRKMFVKADYRGKEKGVAQNLLNQAVAWSKDKRVTDIFLGTTSKFLAAHRFYEKNGFREIDKAALPQRFSAMSIDSKFYHHALAS